MAMTFSQSNAAGRAHGRGWRLPGLLLLALTASGAAADAADLALGQRVYKKANCVGCHKWHGDGGGGYGGAALSLRHTELDRGALVEVVRCGRPGTRMPYHDRKAYAADPCYDGVTKGDLGHDFPPKAAIFLRPVEIDAVVEYVKAQLQGKGAPTHADCIAFWGEAAKQCDEHKG